MNKQQPKESISEQRRQRLTGRNISIVALVLFIALGIGSGSSNSGAHLNARNLLWATVATIGIGAFIWTLALDYKNADERQQHLQLQATGIAFVAVIVGLFVTEMAHALFDINMSVAVQVLFISGIVIWSLVRTILERRSRQ